MKISTQTAVLFTGLAAAVILLLNAVIYYYANRDSANDFRKRLELRVVVASKINFEKDTSSSAAYNELRTQYLETLPDEKEYILQVDSATGLVSGTDQLHLHRNFYADILKDSTTVFLHEGEVYYAGRHYTYNDREYIIIKSAINLYGVEGMKHLRQILFWAFIGKVTLVFVVSILFSRKAFKPFRDMIGKVNSIGVENLSLRLHEKDGKDEIAALAKTFNGMLDRLQTAFDIQNNFVSNASHELKTPLTTVIGEAEIALSKPRTAEEYRDTIQTMLAEAERLETLTSGLLGLAQSGFNHNQLKLEWIRLDELLYDIKVTINRIDPGNKVQLRFEDLPSDEDKLRLHGNYQLLKLAISNIMLNACKYSNNQEVSTSLRIYGNEVTIGITDIGIGIPQEDLKHVFVPFFRASNTSQFKGYGVGLPLSMNIIRQHNGNIRVDSVEGKGTTVTVTLPL
ncbi:MAG: HAMP domain-containing protein [Chitinophagaceae bacterium]|nr:MAG: HAMP domain-containing protein [Chitinophagaceae bacterium]